MRLLALVDLKKFWNFEPLITIILKLLHQKHLKFVSICVLCRIQARKNLNKS